MTVDKSFITYQHLVYLQEQQPTKKRVIELRKALISLKKECDLERKRLLSKSPEVSEVKTHEVSEVVVDNTSVASAHEAKTSVKSPDTKLTEEDVSWQSPLPLSREVAVSVSSSEPVKSVTIKKTSKRQKKAKAQ